MKTPLPPAPSERTHHARPSDIDSGSSPHLSDDPAAELSPILPRGKIRQSALPTPYREGDWWSVRLRRRGQDLYLKGFESKAQAQAAASERAQSLVGANARLLSPERITLAQGLERYGHSRLPFLKGADQECRRINAYLRAAALPSLAVTALDKATTKAANKAAAKDKHIHFAVKTVPLSAPRLIPRGLGEHRKQLASKSASSERIKSILARRTISEVSRQDVQALVDALVREGCAPATAALERALLRRFFNHCIGTWGWSHLSNPATQLRMPKVDNARDRVLSPAERTRLYDALQEARNPQIAPLVQLLEHTAMRCSEPLRHAHWCDVHWQERTIKLRTSKTGKRIVPLAPAAIEALRALWDLGDQQMHSRITTVSYEALKAAWMRACERAEIVDLNLHDLRHTAATNLALASGNLFLVQALTGHKELSMVQRYVNVKATDVLAFWDAHDQDGHAALAHKEPSAGRTSQDHRAAKETMPGSGSITIDQDRLADLVAQAVATAVSQAQGAVVGSGPLASGARPPQATATATATETGQAGR